MIDDRVLVSKVLSGDRHALLILIQQYERLVAHMISRIIDNKEECEELCQDVFLKVYQKLGDFNFQSRLSTWIAVIAYRHAVNHIKKNKVKWNTLPEDDSVGNHFIEVENPASMLEDQDTDSFVLKLVDQLPVQYRTALTLYHLEDMSYAEIGEVTGMPEGTVKNYIFRARTLLKEQVKKYLGKEELL